VPLGQLAEVVEEEGPSVIFREDLKRTPLRGWNCAQPP
jgi:hypothetical protein